MIWRALFRFLGGIHFAILLIAATALFTIAGTFIESSTGSHRYAALLTYGSPLFSMLLWGFFLNILISALRRYPFKRQHLSFLITHFGMLMILAGVLVKSHFGVQGSMTLLEGSASDELILSGSYALSIESRTDRGPQFFTFDKNLLRYTKLKPASTPANPLYESLSLTLLDSTPHGVEKIESWIKRYGNTSYLSFFGTHPIPVQKIVLDEDPLPQPARMKAWDLLAISSDKTEEIAEKVYKRAIQVTIRDTISEKKLFRKPLEEFLSLLDFSSDLPTLWLDEKIAISLDGEKAILKNDQKADKERIKIDLSAIPTLLFLQDSKENVTLYVITKQGEMTSHSYPQMTLESIPEGRILAYDEGFLGYTLEAQLLKTDDPLILETPLSRRHQIIEPTNVLENNIPCVAVRIKKGTKQETISLSYDKFGSGLKWPALDGEFLVRFQPLFMKIPYKLRLRQARQVNYANTQQPYSYECDLLVTDKSNGETSENSISMNNVYETWDGYRFYLANISPSDAGSLKRVQIVVNRDPGKYFLTYPGAIFMTFGILMLFFRKRPMKKGP